jgi:hypothetical protein
MSARLVSRDERANRAMHTNGQTPADVDERASGDARASGEVPTGLNEQSDLSEQSGLNDDSGLSQRAGVDVRARGDRRAGRDGQADRIGRASRDARVSLEEQDDAAFRARLAPLASEVLPPATKTRVAPRTQGRRRAVVMGAAIAGTAACGAVWLFAKWPLSGAVEDHRLAARPEPEPPPVASPLPVPAAVTTPVPASASTSDDMIALLLRRGDTALTDGDIIAARLLYERAAGLGSATAATSVGKTYDIDFLLQSGARGIRPDQTAAAAWFRKAAALGDAEAGARLARIEGRPRP